jgi:hypothetical protein
LAVPKKGLSFNVVPQTEKDLPLRNYSISTVNHEKKSALKKSKTRKTTSFEHMQTGNTEFEMMSSCEVHVDNDTSSSPKDFYMIEHDSEYASGLCFHVVISWIFAPGPKLLDRVVKPLFRRIREFHNGYFKALPISERIRNQELVPFENQMDLRQP